MKKGIIILIMIIILTGCHNESKTNKELKKVTNLYYKEYIQNNVKGLDILEISLGELRELKMDDIDLSNLDDCSDDTKVRATIENNEIVDYEISLKFK